MAEEMTKAIRMENEISGEQCRFRSGGEKGKTPKVRQAHQKLVRQTYHGLFARPEGAWGTAHKIHYDCGMVQFRDGQFEDSLPIWTERR